MTDTHQNKTELDKKPLNKQMVQSLQILRKVYILNITSYHMPILSVTKAPQQTHLSTLMCKKTHISFFIWQGLLIGSFDFWRMKEKNFQFCKIYFLCSRWKFLLLKSRVSAKVLSRDRTKSGFKDIIILVCYMKNVLY